MKEIRIESSLDEMYRVEQFVELISDEYLLYGNYYGNILMAVSEAVKNAVIHGNGSDRQKIVTIAVESTTEGLWIRVSDEGKGFDSKAVFNLQNAEKELITEKNGLFLIHKLADEVIFKNNGRTLDMLFRINGIDESIFNRRVTFMHDFFRVYQRLNT
jgi:serine/threonine-protein kinase RsbW